jgi:hypothetical protein
MIELVGAPVGRQKSDPAGCRSRGGEGTAARTSGTRATPADPRSRFLSTDTGIEGALAGRARTTADGRGGEQGLESGQVTPGTGGLAGPGVMGRIADEQPELTEGKPSSRSFQNGADP